VKLNPVSEKKPVEERMRGKGKSSEKKGEEEYPEPCRRSRDNIRPDDLDFCQIVLQNTNLGGVLPVLLQELGLDLVAHGGRIGVGGLGLRLLGGASSGIGNGAGDRGGSLAHSGGSQLRTRWEWE
jgi:hypothetical protein